MTSSKNSRFLLSTFTAALMIFAWTGASHADLWVAQGTDSMGNPVTVDINVVITQIQVDVENPPFLRDQIQITITNLSPPVSEGTSDLVLETNNPLNEFAPPSFTGPPGGSVLTNWGQAFDSNTLTLTSPNAADTIGSLASASLIITTETIGVEVGGVRISTQDGNTEIAATLVPEPSSMVIATLSALGFLGYSCRRRKAKGN